MRPEKGSRIPGSWDPLRILTTTGNEGKRAIWGHQKHSPRAHAPVLDIIYTNEVLDTSNFHEIYAYYCSKRLKHHLVPMHLSYLRGISKEAVSQIITDAIALYVIVAV